MSPAEKYQQELIQSEKDHHTPTAGAMTGHILANLVIQQQKLRQTLYSAKGTAQNFVAVNYPSILTEENRLYDQLNRLMLDEGEVIPTTTEEFVQYSMLTESGQLKYETAESLLWDAVKDFNTQLLFVTRGIALAEKESKFALAEFLKQIYGFLKHQIFVIQTYLGHEVTEGLLEEE